MKMDFQKITGKMKLRRKRSWQDLKKKNCDENGLPENNWKNEIATKKKLAGI